jgi:hypothetical protein
MGGEASWGSEKHVPGGCRKVGHWIQTRDDVYVDNPTPPLPRLSRRWDTPGSGVAARRETDSPHATAATRFSFTAPCSAHRALGHHRQFTMLGPALWRGSMGEGWGVGNLLEAALQRIILCYHICRRISGIGISNRVHRSIAITC